MDQSLQNLLKPCNDVAYDLHLLTDRQVQDIHWVQAYFQTLQNRGIELTGEQAWQLAQPVKIDAVREMAQLQGIPLEEIDAVNREISLSGRAKDGVARLMEVAEMMEYLPKVKSAPLLTAQAAARMAANIEGLAEGTNQVNLAEAIKEREWIDTGVNKGEPEYLIAAQATQHLSDIFSATLMQANNPELMQDPDIRRAMTAFEVYASQALKRSGKELDSFGYGEAGARVASARDSLHGFFKVGLFTEMANSNALVEDIKKGFERLDRAHVLPVESFTLVNKRLAQAREMNHKGINLLGALHGKHDVNMGSWLARVSAQRAQQGQQPDTGFNR